MGMKRTKRRDNIILFPFREEVASEFHVPAPSRRIIKRRRSRQGDLEAGERKKAGGTGLGVLGLIMSLLAFFMMPVALGISGFIVGYIAAMRGSGIGRWAMGLAVVAVVLPLFLRVLY